METARQILFQAVAELRPDTIKAFREAARSGIPISHIKRMIKGNPEYNDVNRVMPGAMLAAVEVVYEQEKQQSKL